MRGKNSDDKVLVCSSCNESFLFEKWEQKFYREKNLQQPKRCKKCREEMKKKYGQDNQRAKKLGDVQDKGKEHQA